VYDMIETDVLVIGGGGAGCRAAIEAHDRGSKVLLALKGSLGNSGCTLNVGTTAAVGPWGEEGDSNEASLEDLISYGGFLADQDLAKVLVDEAPDRMLEMAEWGIDFERNNDGSIRINRAAEHTFSRNFTFKPDPDSRHDYGLTAGWAMMDTLLGELHKRSILIMEDVVLLDLLKSNDSIVGATAIDCRQDKLLVLKAKSTILATGTYSQIFNPTTVSVDETGDGQAAAYKAGAELIDMESTQFVATQVGYHPASVFLNGKGEPFLHRYGLSSLNGVAKEAMVYAIWKEIREGRGTERETFLLDMRDALKNDPEYIHMSNLKTIFKEKGINPWEEPVETAPQAHTTIGGIRINTRCETNVPGLYAAGAVAGGVYGLARPEGYTSMITLVYGRRAGLFAAEGAQQVGNPTLDKSVVQQSQEKASSLVDNISGSQPEDVKDQIRSSMRRNAWVIKDENGLTDGLKEIEQIRTDHPTLVAKDGFGWAKAVEVPNMLLNAELMLIGSIKRKESRGAFFRDDYPETDNENWLKTIIYKQANSKPDLTVSAIDLKYIGMESRSTANRV